MNTDRERPCALCLYEEALNFDFGLSKINQKAYSNAGCFEIIKALSNMSVVKFFARFQFDDHLIFDHEISSVLTYNDAVIANSYWRLLDDYQRLLSEFMNEGVFIDFFQEPNSQRVGDGVRAPDDRLSELVSAQSVCICVNLWLPLSQHRFAQQSHIQP